LFSSRIRHTRFSRDWSSDVCSSDLANHRMRSAFKTASLTKQQGQVQNIGRTHLSVEHQPPVSIVVRARLESEMAKCSAPEPGQRSEERRVGKRARGTGADSDADDAG